MRARIKLLRYGLTNVLMAGFIVALALGGWPIWIVLALSLAIGGGIDEAVGDDREHLGQAGKLFLDANLYVTLPLLIVMTCLMLALVGARQGIVPQRLGSTSPQASLNPALLGAVIGTGYFYALAGVTVAHELSHRVASPLALVWARTLLAFTLNPTFESYHLQGHHRNVGTYADAATARRGEYVLAFVVRTIVHQSLDGWRIETERLRRRGLGIWTWHNRVFGCIAISLFLIVLAGIMAGALGVMAFLAAAIVGRALHEIVNYVQHYGLVRLDGTTIEARHSWDCHRVLSNTLQYNLPRHGDHHLFASKPFWELHAQENSPTLPHGYETMSMISLFPKWWRSIIDPRLSDWDKRLASDAERLLVRERGWAIHLGPQGIDRGTNR